MTSISGAAQSTAYVWDRSKPLALPSDAEPSSDPTESAYDRWLQTIEDGGQFIPDNRPDNIWGKITLPNGEVVTIYNKGGTESETALDIDWDIEGEAARAEAIMAKYGGTLEIAETATPGTAPVGSDVATLWSNIMESTDLAERLLNATEYQFEPHDLMSEKGAE